jgi:2-polyprenyl-3-methyl-5-hydroxy-6-metoxy-1,4-benzoquinol methylase
VIIKEIAKKFVFKLLTYSLKSASKEQGLSDLKLKLEKINPDLSGQYSSFKVEGDYLVNKVYLQHAFQVSLAQDAISLLDNKKRESFTIVDIGDSSGSHLQYLTNLEKGITRAISVNLDPEAVKKIQKRGFEAIESRAELLHEHPNFNGRSDIFLSYEMVEHLLDPISFLHEMSIKSKCDFFVVTVPYQHSSRVGMHQIRNCISSTSPFNAEVTHIFEFSPNDWDLIFKFSGWRVVKRVYYTQYPKNKLNPFSLLKYVWRKLDFDGFYGVILEKDDSVSRHYQNW